MPNRMIRETYLDSDRYWSLSNDSERLLFHHLMSLADDFGCINISPAFLGRRAFAERPTEARLGKMIAALVDVDLIRIYEKNGVTYAFIPRFRQRLQRFTLKHPMPPKELFQDDKHAIELFNKINNKDKSVTDAQPLDNGLPTDCQREKGREGKGREVEVKTTPKLQTLLENFCKPKLKPEVEAEAKKSKDQEREELINDITECESVGKHELAQILKAKLKAL